MTRLISVLILAGALLGGWQLYKYWGKVHEEREKAKKEAAARIVDPNQLPGMPAEWEPSLQAAEQHGADALRNWLKTYGRSVQDPKLAWVELDYCVMVARQNPAEARRIFALVKKRTPPTSPVWLRIQELKKTYQ